MNRVLRYLGAAIAVFMVNYAVAQDDPELPRSTVAVATERNYEIEQIMAGREATPT